MEPWTEVEALNFDGGVPLGFTEMLQISADGCSNAAESLIARFNSLGSDTHICRLLEEIK